MGESGTVKPGMGIFVFEPENLGPTGPGEEASRHRRRKKAPSLLLLSTFLETMYHCIAINNARQQKGTNSSLNLSPYYPS